ncbi:MAG: D-cysteine desulfhydrase family protein [Theionarchaea archaeon]|nr:D-cysteine desulfhydrase family protein [Theionarchaea archaeon]
MIESIPRISLGRLPTPFEKVPRLSEALDIPNLYIKRDDLTGDGYGGNKIRKLEFLLADALSKEADTIITTGGVHSNFTRATTACAVKAGLKTILVLVGEEPPEYRGNLFLERLMGADIYFVFAEGLDDGARKAEEYMKSKSEELEKEGRTCYVMPVGGSTPVGCTGFANAFIELYNQAKNMGISIDHVIMATGSGGTQAGLVVGKEIMKSSVSIVGIRVGKMSEPFSKMIADKATETAEFLGMKKVFCEKEITTYIDFVGEGYDIPTEEANNAIKLVAQTEAIFLGPVYTGKAMSGLIGLVERGEIPRDDTIVFWHTGGDPALFVGEELLGREFVESLKSKF